MLQWTPSTKNIAAGGAGTGDSESDHESDVARPALPPSRRPTANAPSGLHWQRHLRPISHGNRDRRRRRLLGPANEFKVRAVRSSGRAPPDNAEASSLSYLHDASSTRPNTPGNHRASSVQHPKRLTRAHSQAWDKETQKPTLQSATAMPSVSTESNQKLLDESRNPPEPGD